jgi:hypothetical protein
MRIPVLAFASSPPLSVAAVGIPAFLVPLDAARLSFRDKLSKQLMSDINFLRRIP